MLEPVDLTDPKVKRMRYIGRTIVLTWGACWCLFFILMFFVFSPFNISALILGGGAVIIFLAGILVPWRWEKVGSILLMAEGVVLGILFGVLYVTFIKTFDGLTIFAISLLALPPIVAGVLFFLVGRRLRQLARPAKEK